MAEVNIEIVCACVSQLEYETAIAKLIARGAQEQENNGYTRDDANNILTIRETRTHDLITED